MRRVGAKVESRAMSAADLTAAEALAAVQEHEAWAVIRLRDSATVTLVGGSRSEVEKLRDVPLEEGRPPTADASTGCSRSPSGRWPSVGTTCTTTAPR